MRNLQSLLDLSGRRAIITGGTGHVGLSVGQALVESGASASILDLSNSACEERIAVLSKIRKHGGVAIPCDLRDEKSTRISIQEAIKKMGGLDILVHCAAYVGTTQAPGWAVSFDQQTVEAWDSAMRVNLTSAFTIVQEGREALSDSGCGSVIFIGSHYGLVGPDMRLYEGTDMANPAGYSASKGGLLQLTRYLAAVLAPTIRVNAISPGGIQRGQPEIFKSRYISRVPLARMATEEDIKGAVAYLASDLSSYVTGHNLVVDGGATIW